MSNIIKFQLQSHFQIFKQTLCVFSQMKDINISDSIFIPSPGSYPRGGTWGAGESKLNFLNIVMWHIKLKGMISRPGYTSKFYPRIKLVIFRWGQKVNNH